MSIALAHRERSTVSLRYKELARKSLKSFLGIPSAIQDQYVTFLGPNASSLLATLARNYVNLLSNEDEIVVAEHNHEANITPWIEVAQKTGAKIRWWGIGKPIHLFLSSRTRLVALSHASNVLGCVYDIRHISDLARCASNGKARVVVDGVASLPHRPACMADSGVDWYVISCHKCFGPHLGALCGRVNCVEECDDALRQSGMMIQALADYTNSYYHWENGTVNYEACAGVLGVGVYFERLASMRQDLPCSLASSLSFDIVLKAYEKIWSIEASTKCILLNYLHSCPNVNVLEEAGVEVCSRDRLPIVSFVHETLSSLSIVQWCSKHNITCRNGRFLSGKVLEHYHVCNVDDGVVRFSLAHYNTPTEVQHIITTLKDMDGWSPGM
jgi:selenocysteine lyase/cysteine desulfurase